MRILITGGAGSLGSNLVEKFHPEGHDIFVIDNFETSDRNVLPANLDRLTIVEGSIEDSKLVDKCFNQFKPTHVIHSAAAYKDPDNWKQDTKTNIEGSINVIRASSNFDIQKFIYFQTALCYGVPNSVPITENHPLNPITSYGISKTAGEQLVSISGLPFLTLRLANITGPRLSIGPIPTFYTRLKNNQACFSTNATRDFLDMSDFFSLMEILMADTKTTGIFNVSTGEGHTIAEVYDSVASYLGKSSNCDIREVGKDDIKNVVLDPGLVESTFNWKANVGFKDTIHRMLQWYDKYGVNHIYSHIKENK